MTWKQLLTDMDIQNLRPYCFKFGELYPVFFPEKPCLTRKIHELVFHLPRFVELHKTVGLFSEKEGETLHKVVNQHNRQLVGIRNPAAKQLILHQHLEIAGSGDRASLVPLQRRCRVCMVYFKQGKCDCPAN